MTDPRSLLVKARAVVRHLGHSDGEPYREYKDWHIEVRAGSLYVSVWASAEIVFLAMAGKPVYYRAGPWEEYLDRLFQRTPR